MMISVNKLVVMPALGGHPALCFSGPPHKAGVTLRRMVVLDMVMGG